MNALIRIAPILSIFTFLRLLFDREAMTSLLARDEALADPLEDARRQVSLRVARFVLMESITGLLALAILLLFGLATATVEAVARRVQWLFDSRSFQELADHLAPSAQLIESA